MLWGQIGNRSNIFKPSNEVSRSAAESDTAFGRGLKCLRRSGGSGSFSEWVPFGWPVPVCQSAEATAAKFEQQLYCFATLEVTLIIVSMASGG